MRFLILLQSPMKFVTLRDAPMRILPTKPPGVARLRATQARVALRARWCGSRWCGRQKRTQPQRRKLQRSRSASPKRQPQQKLQSSKPGRTRRRRQRTTQLLKRQRCLRPSDRAGLGEAEAGGQPRPLPVLRQPSSLDRWPVMQARMLDRDPDNLCLAERHQACSATVVARHAGAVERRKVESFATQSACWASLAIAMQRVVSHSRDRVRTDRPWLLPAPSVDTATRGDPALLEPSDDAWRCCRHSAWLSGPSTSGERKDAP